MDQLLQTCEVMFSGDILVGVVDVVLALPMVWRRRREIFTFEALKT